MKKLTCILLVLLTITVSAFAEEITFRDIPWGSNVSNTLDVLPKGYDIQSYEARINLWDGYEDYNSVNNCLKYSIYYDNVLTVAGYNVRWINLCFLYGYTEENIVLRNENDLSLFSAEYHLEVVDPLTSAEDLTAKLSDLYGLGKIGENDFKYNTVTWYGDNNTAVQLEYSDDHITIRYGNTDDTEIIGLTQALIVEEQARTGGNTEGL